MKVSCQFSLYPLGVGDLGPALQRAFEELDALNIQYTVGSMSTLLEGEEEQVFAALARAFHQLAEEGTVVLTATVSNACG